MVTFKQLSEAIGEPQLPSSQEELRKEVERLRIEVQLAARGIEINEGEVDVDIQLPLEALAKGFSSPNDFSIKDGSLKYSDGGVYEGQILGSLRHGKGTYTRGDGAQYIGQWSYDALEGRATAVTPDGQTFEGDWRGGRANGHGTATYPNGSRYEGDFANDGRHGWGTQTFPWGENYEGEWSDDKIQGQGRWTYPDGSYYEGEWHNGIRTKGRLVTIDGSEEYSGGWDESGRSGHGVQYRRGAFKYAGEWEGDKQHGRGKCTYADGSVYDGDWKEGVRCGQGKTTHGAFSYEGGWIDDRPDGQGMCKEENGDRYIGGFSKGERHGFGLCAYADGSKYEGEWREGARSGEGICVFTNGDIYKGSWERNKRHGIGSCRFVDGTRFKGRWEDDGWVQSAADPGRCKVAGAGLTRAEAGRETSFAIQARDEEGNRRLNGGDEFQVQLTLHPEGGDVVENINNREREGEEVNVVSVVATVKDNDDGTYQASYIATVAGVYELSITIGGIEHVADSPYPVRVRPARPSPRNYLVAGQGRARAVAETTAIFEVVAQDEFGNRCAGDNLAEKLQLDIYLEGAGVPKLVVDASPTRDGRLLCSYTAPAAEGYYRIYIEHKGMALPGTPYSVQVFSKETAEAATTDLESFGSIVAVGKEGAAKDPNNNNDSNCEEGGRGDGAATGTRASNSHKGAACGVPDTMRLWEKIAAAAYAADGAADGWDSDEERKNTKESAAEDAYLQKHPDVPVVENLEDLWLVSKLQRERKAKEEQEKVGRMEQMKKQLESTFGPGQVPTQQEAEAALKEILEAEKVEKNSGAVASERPRIIEIDSGSGSGSAAAEGVEVSGNSEMKEGAKKSGSSVRRPREQLLAAAASLDELA